MSVASLEKFNKQFENQPPRTVSRLLELEKAGEFSFYLPVSDKLDTATLNMEDSPSGRAEARARIRRAACARATARSARRDGAGVMRVARALRATLWGYLPAMRSTGRRGRHGQDSVRFSRDTPSYFSPQNRLCHPR